MKRINFEFVYANGYANRAFIPENMELLGIRISENTILYHGMFSEGFTGYEAAERGLHVKDFRLQLLNKEDMAILRYRRDEVNAMLEACGANFRIPAEGVCWVDDGKMLDPTAISFVTGKVCVAKTAWALYKRM